MHAAGSWWGRPLEAWVGDLAAVLAAASAGGVPMSFDYQPPSLPELFRQAVAA